MKPLARLPRMTAIAALLCASSALAQSPLPNNLVLPPLNQDNSRSPQSSTLDQARFGAALAQVSSIEIKADRDGVPANGRDSIRLSIRVLDRAGNLVIGDVPLLLQATRGRFISAEGGDSFAPGIDREFALAGDQLLARNGELKVRLQAPGEPGDVTVRASAGTRQATLQLSFVADLREMIAVGLIEGIINFSRFSGDRGNAILAARPSDGFEREIRNLSRDFDNGRGAVGARTAFFLKGRIKGETLLTAAYDSDKDVRDRLFRDIRPDEFYPVYGDASLVGFDAQSGSRLYVRLDNGQNFLLWGDFLTADTLVTNEASQLGRYSRALTGVQGQYGFGDKLEIDGSNKDRVTLKGFASKDSLRQVVEELPARGISGPYALRYPNGVAGSERVEILVRDRNAPSIVLQITPLARFVDYDFEPFSGRLLFKAPVPSLDANLNPISIRVVYEVEDGGPEYWVYGAEATLRSRRADIGVSWARDENELAKYELAGVNTTVRLGDSTRLVAEFAQSTGGAISNFGFTPVNPSIPNVITLGEQSGSAARFELRHADGRTQARLYGQRTGNGFSNLATTTSLGLNTGRTEAGGKATYALTDTFRLTMEALRNEDELTQGSRSGAFGGVAWDLSSAFTVELGLRHAEQKGAGATIPATGAAGPLPGTTLSPISGGSIVDPASAVTAGNAPYENTSVKAKLTWRPSTDSSLFVEGEQAIDDNADGDKGHAAAVGGEYRFANFGRLYGRSEWASGLGGDYGLNGAGRQSASVIGLDTQYMTDGQLFSEYRLRDAFGGRESVAAAGLRNVWRVAEGWRLNTAVERVKVLDGQAQEGKAVAVGLDYLGSPVWKGSTRLEWRQDGDSGDPFEVTSWLHSVAAARKLSEDWTLLARNLYLKRDAADNTNDATEDRFQIGAAWRQTATNVWTALARYEFWLRKSALDGEDSRKHIVSTDVSYHPSRPWWFYGKLAGKWVDADVGCITDALTGATTDCVNVKTDAQLLQGRVIHDITSRWDVGLIVNLLGEDGMRNRRWGYAGEVGYLLGENLWVSAGYTFRGVNDKDLALDYATRGFYLRLRFKFDEKLFSRGKPALDRSVVPAGQSN